ncbi:hypothetical protein [Nonomuraea longicatena]|uniref:Uncharacterized protein n=1 Tax=Nonomuraea longicatena TaxID=83682 RepID=A0ABP4AJ34_9ACTN
MSLADLTPIHDRDLADHPAAQPTGPAARALMNAIMSEEPAPAPAPARRKPRRLLILGTAAATLAAAVTLALTLPPGGPATEYANAAVAINRDADQFTVTVIDPTAERERFEEAFRAVGLNVTVKIIPTEPKYVGTMLGPIAPGGFEWSGHLGRSTPKNCDSAHCAAFSVPSDYPGRIAFGIGRAARPGERYAETDLYDQGQEPLDGYTLSGKTVETVRAALRERGLTVHYRLLWDHADGGYFDQSVPAERVKDAWIVDGGKKSSSDGLDLYIKPGPEAGPAPDSQSVAEPQWYDQP